MLPQSIYKLDHVHTMCWFTYCGVTPADFSVLYADPKMFDILEKRLELYEKYEKEAVKNFEINGFNHDS